MDDLIYHTCDGRPSDIKALESTKTYIEFLSIINNHLKRVKRAIEEAERFKKENK
jgi:hypothetical protein